MILVTIILVMPVMLVSGATTQNGLIFPHIQGIQLGDRPFSSIESFNFFENNLKVFRGPDTTSGFSYTNFKSPLGDHFIVNYTIILHRNTFTVNFPQPSGYQQRTFQGQRSVENVITTEGYSPFNYMTLTFIIRGIKSAQVNGINISGVNYLSGYPIYNISLLSGQHHYDFYLPGFVTVNGSPATSFFESYFSAVGLIVKLSFGIGDGNFLSNFTSVISSSDSQYASEYMYVLSGQGVFVNIYAMVVQNYYSIIIGSLIRACKE